MNDLEKKESVSVTILGKTIKLACPVQDIERLYKANAIVNERIDKMKKSGVPLSSEQYLMMVSIELAYDLEKNKDAKPQDEFTEKLKDIQNFLSSALANNEGTN